MSGNSRIEVGDVTTSSVKGKAMESALNSALNNPIPPKTEKKK